MEKVKELKQEILSYEEKQKKEFYEKIEGYIKRFSFHNKKNDFKILAININNLSNLKTWILIDEHLKTRFKNKQPVIKIGGMLLKAESYPINTKLIFDADKNKKYLVPKEKWEELKENKGDILNKRFELIAERRRISGFGGIWEIYDEKLNNDLHEQMIGLKLDNILYLADDYRSEVYLVRNKMNNQKLIINHQFKIVSKRN